MDPIQLDFWVSGAPVALGALTALVIALRGQWLPGLLLLLPFAFLLGHAYCVTYASNDIFSFENVMTPYNEMEMQLVIPDWYRYFLHAKAVSYLGWPVGIWLLARRRPG